MKTKMMRYEETLTIKAPAGSFIMFFEPEERELAREVLKKAFSLMPTHKACDFVSDLMKLEKTI